MEAPGEYDPEKEQEVDMFAIEHTLTEAEEQEVVEALPLTPDEIDRFAAKFTTHQGIILGRLARKGYLHNNYGFENGFYREINLSQFQ